MKKYLSLLTLVLFAAAIYAFRTEDEAPAPNTMPDLVITDISLQCAQDENRWLVFHVANIGSVRLPIATQIRIRPTDGDDPTQKCIQQAVKAVPKLYPGQDFKLRVPLKAPPGCDCQGPLQFDLFVDHKNLITELDETNNQEYFNVDL